MEKTSFLIFLFLLSCPNGSQLVTLLDTEIERELHSTAASLDEDTTFQIVELPFDFSFYDLNKDGEITLEELSDITETLKDDASLPFRSADLDGNAVLSEQEFKDAPWVFSIPKEVNQVA